MPYQLVRQIPGFLLLLIFSLSVAAQPRQLVKGDHFQELKEAVPTEAEPDQIEVREIFWYGCPQCLELSSLMQRWGEGVTGDLMFTRSPATWNKAMNTHARMYYAAEALGISDKVHADVYIAIHNQHNPLRSRREIENFFSRYGVDENEFNAIWDSSAVAAAVETAQSRSKAYELHKLPALIVNGRYKVILNQHVPTYDDMIITVNLLIKMLRDVRRTD